MVFYAQSTFAVIYIYKIMREREREREREGGGGYIIACSDTFVLGTFHRLE